MQAFQTYKLGGKLSELLYSPALFGVDLGGELKRLQKLSCGLVVSASSATALQIGRAHCACCAGMSECGARRKEDAPDLAVVPALRPMGLMSSSLHVGQPFPSAAVGKDMPKPRARSNAQMTVLGDVLHLVGGTVEVCGWLNAMGPFTCHRALHLRLDPG